MPYELTNLKTVLQDSLKRLFWDLKIKEIIEMKDY